MTFFNEAFIKALVTKTYICSDCGSRMEFEDQWEDILVCPNCGKSIDIEYYGLEDEESYESLYPPQDDVTDK